MCLVTRVRLFETPWTVAHQTPLSVGLSRQEYWSGLPCSPPGDLPNPGLNPGLMHCRWILYLLSPVFYWSSQVVLVEKNQPANSGDIRDVGLTPGSGRSPGEEHGNPLQYSCLENSMNREAWWATVYWVEKSWTWLSDSTTTTTNSLLSKKTEHNTHFTELWED